MEMKIKSPKKLLFHNLIQKEGDVFSAICLELDVASQGKTPQEAEANLKEAVELFLETVYEQGWEKELIPRPAPRELWLKYFKLEEARLRETIKTEMPKRIQFETRIIGG